MKKSVLFVFVMLLLTCLTWAKPISLNQAKQVANNIMMERGSFIKSTITDNIVERDNTGQPLIYIFNFKPASFVMVSAEDNVVPLLGFCLDQTYSNSNHPIQFDDMMASFRGQIQYARLHRLNSTTEINNDWARLSVSTNNFIPNHNRDRDVTPILQSTWGQESYYNAYTPSGTPVGCVAVAMGQIMKRWSFPTTGTGSNSYSCPPYGTLSADFSTSTYAWSTMPNALSSANPDVAGLLSDLGISVNMDYAPGASGATDAAAASALVDHFSYKSTLSVVNKNGYPGGDVAWTNLMRAEIDAGRPMYYAGYGINNGEYEGHAFNLDGYTISGNLFHFNWGWYGYYNGYFTLTSLNPGGSVFNDDCSAIIGIQPTAAAGGTLSEAFNGVTAPAMPTGWIVTPASTWVTATAGTLEGTNSAYYTAVGTAFSGKRLVTPKLTVVAGNTISFYAKRGSTTGVTIKVKWSSDAISYSDFSTPISQSLTGTATTYSFPIGTYKTGDYYVAFETYTTNSTGTRQIYLDSVVGPALWINSSPVITLNTSTWNAGNVASGSVGSSGDIFTITNTGLASLTITSAVISGPSAVKFNTNFNTGTVLQYNQSYSFGFNYEPTIYTSDTDTLTIVTNGGTKKIVLTGTCQYNIISDGFESYTDFALSFPPWTCTDVDLKTTYGMNGVSWANAYAAQAFIIFNPSTTVPPLAGEVNAPHGGAKMACSFASVPGSPATANNDYLITQLLSLSGSGSATVNFWAKSYDPDYLETFKVKYSTSSNAVGSFSNTLATVTSVPNAWTFYTYTLTAVQAAACKYIAINNIGLDKYILMIDDFYIHDATTPPAPPSFGNVEGFVYAYGTTTPIPNALVTVGVKTATTNASGYYKVNNLIVGTYTMTCSAPGTFYFSTTQASVAITSGATTEQAFGLKWSTIAANPTTLTQTLNPFATADQTLTITNPTGTDSLRYAIIWQTASRNSHTPNLVSNGLKKQVVDIEGTNSARINFPHAASTVNDRSAGWADYSAGLEPTSITWAGPERGVYYSLNDWGLFSNGVTLTQLRHTFYEDSDHLWGADSTFTFKIYDAAGTTVLFTSPSLSALKYPLVTTYTLPTPMTFTSDFIVVVRPIGATTAGYPLSVFSDNSSGYSYVNSGVYPATSWGALDGEFLQGAYIAGDEWGSLSSYSGVVAPGGSKSITVHFDSANLNGVTKTANAVFVNNSNYIKPRGDDFLVPLTLNVNSVVLHYGTYKGNVLKSGTTTPIPNATVTIWGLSDVTDVNGYFEIPNILVGTYSATCTAPTDSYYYDETVTGVVINAEASTTQNIYLTKAELIVSPSSFSVSVAGGALTDRTLTISNTNGTHNLLYAIDLWDTSARSESPTLKTKAPVVDMSHSELLPADVQVHNTHGRSYGWYGYTNTDDSDIYTWSGTERATKFVLHDLGLLKPVKLQVLSSFFYNPSATPWTDATFHFVVYAADGTTVLYTSPAIEATSLSEVQDSLATPLEINGDFYLAVVPSGTSDSSPFNLGTDLYSGNSYYKSSGVWTLSTSEYLNFVKAEGAGWLSVSNSNGTVLPNGTTDLSLYFDATGLENTSRTCTIKIYNNAEDVRDVPVTFTITGGEISGPTGLTVSTINNHPVISWDTLSGATSYNVYGSDDPYSTDWGTPLVSHTTSRSYVDTSGALYHFYKVTAIVGAKSNVETNIGTTASKPVKVKK